MRNYEVILTYLQHTSNLKKLPALKRTGTHVSTPIKLRPITGSDSQDTPSSRVLLLTCEFVFCTTRGNLTFIFLS